MGEQFGGQGLGAGGVVRFYEQGFAGFSGSFIYITRFHPFASLLPMNIEYSIPGKIILPD